jgi:hypothetical protein
MPTDRSVEKWLRACGQRDVGQRDESTRRLATDHHPAYKSARNAGNQYKRA